MARLNRIFSVYYPDRRKTQLRLEAADPRSAAKQFFTQHPRSDDCLIIVVPSGIFGGSGAQFRTSEFKDQQIRDSPTLAAVPSVPATDAPATRFVERKGTPITPSFLGLVKRGICPVCGGAIEITFGNPPPVLCGNCGEYLELVNKELVQLDQTLVRGFHAFAAPTPWTDIVSPAPTVMHFDLETALTEMVLTSKERVRVLDAKWPAVCCVCGKAATREETITEAFIFNPPGRAVQFRQREATFIARGVPHCAEHKDGARFNRVMLATPISNSTLGLFFRSYPFQIQFRKLNPWKWPI